LFLAFEDNGMYFQKSEVAASGLAERPEARC
jgi:hypothetical protein